MRRMLLLTAIVAVVAASAALAKVVPRDDRAAERLAARGHRDRAGNTFYVGSIPTGAVYRGDLRTGQGAPLVPGATGRAAIGVEHDRGRLFVAGRPDRQGVRLQRAHRRRSCGRCSSRPAAARRS